MPTNPGPNFTINQEVPASKEADKDESELGEMLGKLEQCSWEDYTLRSIVKNKEFMKRFKNNW